MQLKISPYSNADKDNRFVYKKAFVKQLKSYKHWRVKHLIKNQRLIVKI